MLFQSRSLATAISLAPQFLLQANMAQYQLLGKNIGFKYRKFMLKWGYIIVASFVIIKM
jgi:hypothetical protein